MPNRIRELRSQRAQHVSRGLFSRTALAARLGVSESTLARWEQGQMKPHPRHAKALARELSVTVQELGLDDSTTDAGRGKRRGSLSGDDLFQ
jgi:transcriptional regulator with XRE-family HTH domain